MFAGFRRSGQSGWNNRQFNNFNMHGRQNMAGQNPYFQGHPMGQFRPPMGQMPPQMPMGQPPMQMPMGQMPMGQMPPRQSPPMQMPMGRMPSMPMGQMGQMGPPMGQMPERQLTPEEMGITFEPVDSLFSGRSAPENAPAEINNESNFNIGDFVQNERNAALFYDHLAAIADAYDRNTSKSNLLGEIAEICRSNSRVFGEMYKKKHGQNFEIRQTQVDTSVNLTNGIKWALREEGRAIMDLSTLLEEKGISQNEILAIICRKIATLGILTGLI